MLRYFNNKLAKLILPLLMVGFTFLANTTFAQSRSHDGNRWYEIEMSIFTNQPLNSQAKENSFPEQITLSYPDDIIELSAFAESYQYDFPEIEPIESRGTDGLLLADKQASSLGPEFNPASPNFRLKNPDSDAFIALGAIRQFQRINHDIANSAKHRLLFHAVWRQPVLNKVQASAIFIRGGVQYGIHNELEGSVTLSYNINRIDIDPLLWLSSFSRTNRNSAWSLPPQPFDQAANTLQNYSVDEVVLIDETRQMISNELHYLDHPDFGLLIEVRPYELPYDSSEAFELEQ